MGIVAVGTKAAPPCGRRGRCPGDAGSKTSATKRPQGPVPHLCDFKDNGGSGRQPEVAP
ncbi:MAG: hypothetical protein JW847_01450 [Candidatus Omnitrophica bacterium]|nr:hypothetical protein [Candidatus Omnitrophota bacterium]